MIFRPGHHGALDIMTEAFNGLDFWEDMGSRCRSN